MNLTRLREAREKAGITQRDLAQRIGLSEGQIYRYEKGTSDPYVRNIIAIAIELNVSIDYLCGLSDVPFVTKMSEDEAQLLDNWHRGDINAVIDIFANKLRKYRDSKTGVSRVEPAVNKS